MAAGVAAHAVAVELLVQLALADVFVDDVAQRGQRKPPIYSKPGRPVASRAIAQGQDMSPGARAGCVGQPEPALSERSQSKARCSWLLSVGRALIAQLVLFKPIICLLLGGHNLGTGHAWGKDSDAVFAARISAGLGHNGPEVVFAEVGMYDSPCPVLC